MELSKREKRYLKIVSIVVFFVLLFGSLLFLPNQASGAESICITNKFESKAHLWVIQNQGKGSFKNRHLKFGEETCYVVDNGKMILIKVEVNHFGGNFQQRWVSLKTLKPGRYKILIGKTQLEIRGIK